jgi:sarcosine oxidase, subunit beta
MKTTSDAVIIGAGVIGAATAFELGKRGYQTLNIDKLPGAGYGPTSSSCPLLILGRRRHGPRRIRLLA